MACPPAVARPPACPRRPFHPCHPFKRTRARSVTSPQSHPPSHTQPQGARFPSLAQGAQCASMISCRFSLAPRPRTAREVFFLHHQHKIQQGYQAATRFLPCFTMPFFPSRSPVPLLSCCPGLRSDSGTDAHHIIPPSHHPTHSTGDQTRQQIVGVRSGRARRGGVSSTRRQPTATASSRCQAVISHHANAFSPS